jgi:ABC-2 type transport system ATP-binding protein
MSAMNIIEAIRISKSYQQHVALKDVSLQVPVGSVFGMLGPNGAGKTSLIRIMNQITAPDSGELLFNGRRISPEDVESIGYLPEERGLYRKMKIGEQCLYLAQLKGLGKREAHKKLKEWFQRFEIDHWWDKKVEDLSKGMAQKVQFISTVIHDPQLLILDEPFSGFDPINAEIIRKEMLKLRDGGCTIILSTHDMGSVESLCSHIALINRAEVILTGTVKEVKNRFKTHTWRIAFSGMGMDLGIALWAQFELLRTYQVDGTQYADIRIAENLTLNDLLRALIPHIDLHEAQEIIPSMEEIFIESVQQFNKSHE